MVLAGAGDARPVRIETTLDADLQADVRGIIRSQRAALASHHASNVAVVVLENATGEWLAWEGSGGYFDADHGGAINGPLVPRQPGSALKPFTYALAFESGYTPASVLPDVPTHFPTTEAGVVYSPRNYDGVYRGPLLARAALAGSENVPAVALAADLGVPSLVRFLRRAGLTTLGKNASFYGLGITLGNAEVRLDELVVAYAAFARGGTWLPARAVRSAPSAIVGGEPAPGEPLVSPRTAFWITDILADAEAREYIFGRGGALELPFPVAVKTGTSQGYHDNWTVGYTREVTVGVWVGNFDRTPLVGSSGVTGAGPIFHAVMLATQHRVAPHEGVDSPAAILPVPSDVTRAAVCALSGMPAGAACPVRRSEWLPKGLTSPPCSWHHASDDGLLVIWPSPFRAWAKQRGLLADAVGGAAVVAARLSGGPAPLPASAARPSQRPLAILSPPDGAVYLIDPALRPQYQTLTLRASAPRAGTRIQWFVDGRPVGTADADDEVRWPLTRGEHRIEARDGAGRRSTADVLVK
jgi:penicillin-binding protein 1C